MSELQRVAAPRRCHIAPTSGLEAMQPQETQETQETHATRIISEGIKNVQEHQELDINGDKQNSFAKQEFWKFGAKSFVLNLFVTHAVADRISEKIIKSIE